MEEIEATRVALDSRLVNAYRLRWGRFSVCSKLHSFEKSNSRQRFGIKLDQAFLSNIEQPDSSSVAMVIAWQ